MVRAAVIGYGASYSQGKHHIEQIEATEGIETVAICDTDSVRRKIAAYDYSDMYISDSIEDLLNFNNFDLLIVVLPHYLHAPIACLALENGKHVVVEKPMCITVQEATEMINLSQKYGKMLSVYHNRRWDADFCTIKNIINNGTIGDLIHLSLFKCVSDTRNWRSDIKKSGGIFYDWGSHMVDWALRVVDKPLRAVLPLNYKEQHTEVVLKFSGTFARIALSTMAYVSYPLWIVEGSSGSIYSGRHGFNIISFGTNTSRQIFQEYNSDSGQTYYQNIAARLINNDPLLVTAEQGKEVVAVLEEVKNENSGYLA